MNKIKIIVADDHPLFRKGLITLVSDFRGMEVVAEANDGEELLALLNEGGEMPDLILMDVTMPRLSGLEATSIIKEKYPEIKIIAISMHDDEQMILHLVEAGASSYLYKDADPEEVEKAIHAVLEKGIYFNERVSLALSRSLHKSSDDPFKNLKKRELQVLELICREHSNSDIARKLELSPRTVENYRATLREKVGAKTTAGLISYALKHGLIK